MVMKRAYSILTVKSVDEEQRILTGIATTPTPDRIGDIVESEGAQFKLPIPLLWQHDARQPVGEVFAAKVSAEGIEVQARIKKIPEEGKLKDRLDEAWQSIKHGLVRGLSIGFKPLEESFNKETYSFHFLKWLWLELSAVTIPANSEATIQTIKSFDAESLAASGLQRKGVVKLSAGVTAAKSSKPLESNMTLAEQLKAFEAKRAAAQERMESLMAKSAEEGRTLEDAESEEYDTLETEIKAIDAHLVRLRKTVATQITKATPIVGDRMETPEDASRVRAGGPVTVKDNLPPGIEFARYAICLAVAKGSKFEALELAKNRYPDQPRIANYLKAQLSGQIEKTAIAGGSSTHTTWAGPLVQVDFGFLGDFVEYLRPRTIIGRFGTNGIPSLRRVPFNVSVPGQTSGGTGYWVGEGAPKPVTKFDFTRTTVPFSKVANIAVLTEELIRFSSPSAETVVRDELARCLIQKLDVDFVDPAKAISAGISPASVTNGASAVVATGYTLAALQKDLVTLQLKFTAADLDFSSAVYIMAPGVAMNIAGMVNALGQYAYPTMSINGGTLNGIPVIVSNAVATVNAGSPTIARPIIVLLSAQDIWLADDGGVSIDISREASLQMDTAPTNTPTGLGASPNAPTAVSLVSMFQTDSVAIRAEREIAWLKRRSAAAQYISNASYAV